MCPLTIGVGSGASVAIEGKQSMAVPALLGSAYLFSVRSCLDRGGSQVATALANTTSYAGFYTAAKLAVGKLRSDSEKLQKAREQTVIERERLAAERQRNREHRLLHDSALQTLELVATNVDLDPELVRRQARREAAMLRRAIAGGAGTDASLTEAILDLAHQSIQDGLRVELALVDADADVAPDTAEALLGAVREALTNVAKHAGVSQALVTLSRDQNGFRISVRDRGTGFVHATDTDGFGIKNSIIARLTEVGGSASIDSTPGHGTKVTLWVPNETS